MNESTINALISNLPLTLVTIVGGWFASSFLKKYENTQETTLSNQNEIKMINLKLEYECKILKLEIELLKNSASK